MDLSLQVTQKALALREERHQLLASHLAHIDTPGYVPQDFNIHEALLDQESGLGVPLERFPFPMKADGNTIDEERLRVEFTKNAMEYMASLTFLQQEYHKITQAIRGEV